MACHTEAVIIISRHASKRMKERLGLNKSAHQRLAERAYRAGIRADALPKGAFRAYVESKMIWKDGKKVMARILNHIVFLFVDNTLITVFPIAPAMWEEYQITLFKRKKMYDPQEDNGWNPTPQPRQRRAGRMVREPDGAGCRGWEVLAEDSDDT